MSPFIKCVCACAALIAATATPLTVSNAHETKPGTIAVSATGEASVTPDMAIITLTVLREAPTAKAALDSSNEAMAAVLATMKAKGIEDRDLQTSNFNIQPRYAYDRPKRDTPPTAPKIDGYLVNNTLSVRLRDLSKLGIILDESVTLGVNSGGHIAFTSEDPTAANEQARESAVKNAMAKARTIVTAAGVSLGPILEISEADHQPPRPMAMRNMAAESAADAVPIAAGENVYRVTVNIRWEIAQ